MVGMLQIITYLLCIYLVFKGYEILQIALASTKENKEGIITMGVIALVASVLIAIAFVGWIDEMASSISNSSSMDFGGSSGYGY